jgi:alkanesulfonate monooxygenase SsuD/methylene tetrahydromethanopterin reductase-like flavin-dependent oxidoreductase (luciferase family)
MTIGSTQTHAASLERLGVALWTMQSTVAGPGNFARLYHEFPEDVELVERYGFASVWTAEHRIWYDGCCPALLHAQALAVSRTSRVRFGNAMLLGPQHDPVALARAALTLDRLSEGRVDLGLALGHRDAEFDALGLRRDRRARLIEQSLDVLAEVWAGQYGDAPPAQPGGPPVWIGGMAPAVISRAARGGYGLVLPPTLSPERTRMVVDSYNEQADRPGRAQMGMLRDVFIASDAYQAADFRARLQNHYREEIGSWWVLKGGVGFQAGEEVDRQLSYNDRGAIVGSAEQVAEGLAALFAAGVTHIALRLNYDFMERAAAHEQIARVAQELAPLLDRAGALK